MAPRLESSRSYRPPPARVAASGARARTRAGLGSSGDRCRAATRLPGSARPAWFGALAAAVLGAGCTPYVEGNGVYHEEDRTPAEAFTGIQVQDGIVATVSSGEAQQKVVVSGDANIVKDYVKTELVSDQGSGPVLHVWVATGGGTVDPDLPLRVVVDLAELRYVYADGDSHVNASGVATLLLEVSAYAKSTVLVMGDGGGRIEVVASEASVDAASYPVAEGALVDLSSGARAELHSAGAVSGTVRGGSTLQNFGDGLCQGVVVPVNETATIQCPVP